jgi:predicted acylesterase/phospholipase RssA
MGRAVAASCAIPAYFAPVRIEGLADIDGGMHSPTNADVLGADPSGLVVVVSPMSIGPTSREDPCPHHCPKNSRGCTTTSNECTPSSKATAAPAA